MIRDIGVLITLACLFLPFAAANYTEAQPIPTVVPATYCLDCGSGVDYQSIAPDLGPVGILIYSTWDRLNPAPGMYDWADLDRQIEAEAGLWVTIDGPEPVQVPKPIQLYVAVSLWNPPRCYSPTWLGADACLTLSIPECGGAPIPNYASSRWQAAHWTFVRALGAKYGDDPRVGSIIIGSIGVDGEAKLAKDSGGCSWTQAAMGVPGLEYRWGQVVKQSIVQYREAFPQKPLFFPIATGGQARCVWADICAAQSPVVGLKHNGMWYDLPDWQVGDAPPCCGSWTAIEQHPELPIMVESKLQGGTEANLWALYAGLSTAKPGAMVVHPDFLTTLPDGYLRRFAATLGKSANTTPFAWIVFRDQEFVTDPWCDTSGKLGDHAMWLSRTEGGTLYQGDAVPSGAGDSWQGRQVRRGPMTLALDADFDVSRGCAATIVWYDELAEPWAFSWFEGDKRRTHVVQGTGSRTWKEEAVTAMKVDANEPLGIEGGQLYHSVLIASWANLLNDPTPTQEVTPTWTETAMPTPTWTSTRIPIPTETPTPNYTFTPETSISTPTIDVIFTSTPAPLPTWTIDEQIYKFRHDLEGRLFHDLGGFWVVDVTLRPATSTYPTLSP